MYAYSDWPSLVLQLDQALRDDEEGKALIEVLQTCKRVLAHKSEPKVRMQDRAVQASQGVLDHLLASQMASAVSQAGHALAEHGTLRSKGRGHVVQDLDACVQGCAPQDLFPLAYFLASCVSSLVEKAVRADIEMMSSNWRVLQEKLQSACGVVNILASNSPPCGDAFNLGAWMKGLVPELKDRGTTSSKFSDGIAANAVTNDGGLPVPKQFYPQDYRPPRFLEALKGLVLDDAAQYRVCGECDLITKDFEQHCKKSGHGLSEARHPTMDDVVRKAVQFGKKCRSDPDKQQICQLLKDDDDIHALYVYTLETEIYSKMNAAMRNDIPSPEAEKWRPVIYHIHRALRNLPSHSLTQLYRGIDCKVQNYDEGRFILWHQFSSSTVNPDIVKDFTAEGGSIFILRPSEASQGHLIDFLSEFEKEKEVLFAANTWFRVQQKLKDGTKRFLAQHMGIEWEVMKEIDVYELHEVTEDLARQEHAAQQQKAVQLQEGAQLLAQRASRSLVAHVLEGNAEACMQDVKDGADVQQVHQGTSLIVLAAMRDMDDVCVAMAQRVQSISIAPNMACAAGLYKAFDRFPKELVSVIIGEGNHVGEAGALAMASRCEGLRSLHSGLRNGLGLEGVKQILHSCPLLEDISIGGHHCRRVFSNGDIRAECSTIEVLDAGGRRLDPDGEFLIAALYPGLHSIVLDCCTDIGAEIIAKHCSLLTAVSINSITTCGVRAIGEHCTSLTSLTIGDNNGIGVGGARAIGEHCTSLTSLTIGGFNQIGEGGARAIGEHCTTSLTSLTIGDGNEIGEGGARAIGEHCTSLTSLTIGGGNEIGEGGARAIGEHCTSLTSLTIGDGNKISKIGLGVGGARAIGEHCTTSLTSLTISGGKNGIGEGGARAIGEHCTSLTSLTIGGGNEIGEGGARAIGEHCTSLTSLTIGGGNEIGEGGARAIGVHCTSLTSLTIGGFNQIGEGGARAIGEHCTSLTSLTIGDGNGIGEGGTRAIGEHCTSLTSLTIGGGNKIGEGGARAIGEHCTSLTSLTIGDGNKISKIGLGVGGARAIGVHCTSLTSLTIGGFNQIGEGGARAIGEHCTSLTSLTIGDGNGIGEGGTRAIGEHCTSLTSLTIGGGNEIGEGGARAIGVHCTSLTSLTIGGFNQIGEGGARAIGEHCTSLTSLTIGDGNGIGEGGTRAIGEHCTSLTSLTIGGGNKIGEGGARAIGEHCTSLTSLTIGDGNGIGEGGTRAIGEHCTSLTSLTIGGGNKIGEGGARAIGEHCTSLTSLTIGDGNKISKIGLGVGGARAIGEHCTSLTSLKIGDNNRIGEGGVRAIGEHCTSLTSLTIGDKNGIGEGGARAIGEHCTSLTSLTIGSFNEIGEGGARAIGVHCTSLTSLTISRFNQIGEGGARAIGEHFTSLTPLTIGARQQDYLPRHRRLQWDW